MFPLFPFVAGVLTGAVALRLIKTDKTKAGLDKAQDKLRDATVSSLEAIEHASARARKRLTAAEAEGAAAASSEAAEPAKPAPRKRAPRTAKPAAKTTARAATPVDKEDAES